MSAARDPGDTMRSRGLGATGWIGIAVLVVVLDQWTKHLVIGHFAEFDSIVLLPVLDLMRLHNEGAAFSILAGASGWQRWMFISLGIGVSVGILVWLYRLPARGQTLLAVALSFVMGGALGNVIDRVRFGYVVDFIRVHYEDWYFPAFNVADSAITIGAALLILDSIIHASPRPAAEREPASSDVEPRDDQTS